MNIDDIFKKALTFRLAQYINYVPHVLRGLITSFCFVVATLSFSALFLNNILPRVPKILEAITTVQDIQIGLAFVSSHTEPLTLILLGSLCVALLGSGLNSFYTYHYLRGVRRIFKKQETDITYEVAEVVSKNVMTLSSLVNNKESAFLIKRLQLDREYLLSHFGNLSLPSEISTELFETHVTLGALWRAMYESSEELRSYMLSASVKKKTLFRTSVWMDRLVEERKRKSAWWWRENLSKIRGFAKTLSYGMTGYIALHANEMILDRKITQLGETILHQDECNQLEEILAKGQGSNAVLVGPDGSGRYSVTLALTRAIEEGHVYAEIEHKRMFLLNVSSFELINDKILFENTLINTFNEAVTARNIIFVIDEVAKIVEMSVNLGVDFWSLIDPYIEHGAVSLVVLANETTYSKEEYRRIFDKRFEVIKMRDLDSDLLLPYLEDKALAEERMTGKYFTYTGLEVIANALPTFFVEDAPLVKASALLETIVSTLSSSPVITDQDVSKYLETTTGVSLGKIGEGEKEQLLHLEEILSQNVKGQKEAVSAIAKTMRRVRSGITDTGKPMGTFLFFGPTGSGKTETAKTLAKVFFGSEEYMSRLDMGEYALADSAERLLGGRDDEGELAKLIHQRPHGVLLLDEFEKSSRDVKDLFLRVLDEGVFTNGQGHVVSLRTQIIIATSNAGTALILESHLSSEYDDTVFAEVKKKVIDYVLSQGIFKPELVNRFDAAVMFLPLSRDATTGVARKMLDELGSRVQERGYNVVWADDLVDYVVANSNAAEFGGRAIQRMIQDTIEDILSKKIIEGEIKEGDTLTLSRKDIPGV